jgi:hypothetical protein
VYRYKFEDCLNLDVYKDAVIEEFGVDLQQAAFRANQKWSDRVRSAFLHDGKRWNDGVESKVKYVVAEAVLASPEGSLNQHKRNSIDSLIKSLESFFTS